MAADENEVIVQHKSILTWCWSWWCPMSANVLRLAEKKLLSWFGRSSRPDFSSDAMEVERQLVQSVEEWRREMKLPKMILLGHSMGGFLAGAYAIAYPDRVKHLILADPWGLPPRPPADESKRSKLPWWARALLFTMEPLNPLWAIRVAGPFGQKLVEKMRPDLLNKFSIAVDGDTQAVSQYIFQCNAQRPSGESAFHALNSGLGWAKNPLVNRIDKFSDNLPITVLYGSRSWMDNRAGQMIIDKRPSSCYTDMKIIMGAGHHVYADKSEVFNETVNGICQFADECSDTEDNIISSSVEDIRVKPLRSPQQEVSDVNAPRTLHDGDTGTSGDAVERKEEQS